MRKRGHRVKRHVEANVIGMVLSRISVQTPEELDAVHLAGLSTIEALKAGNGRLQDVQELVNMLNLSETLCSLGIGPEAEQSIAEAHLAFMAIRKRIERWGKVECMPKELEALSEMYGWFDAQRRSVDRGTLDDAAKLCAARLKTGHRSVVEW